MTLKFVLTLLAIVVITSAATLEEKPTDTISGPFAEDDVEEAEPSHGETEEKEEDYPVDELAIVTCSFHGEYIRHPGNCAKFFQCSHGTPYLHNCPSGLYFNTNLNVCDWPANVNCNNDVACITRKYGRLSGSEDDAVSVARCPKGSVPINCQCHDPRRCDGTTVEGRECRAVNSAGAQGARAVATCVSASDGEFVTAVSGGWELSPRVRCAGGYRMINCFLRNAWNHVKYAFPLRYRNRCDADTTCSAGEGCYLQAICQRVSGLYTEDEDGEV